MAAVSHYFSAAELLIAAAFRTAAEADLAADADVAARRLLLMIDGLGAQKVIRDAPTGELKHIASAYVASELHAR